MHIATLFYTSSVMATKITIPTPFYDQIYLVIVIYSSPVNGNLANPTPRNKIHFCGILYVSKALEPS